MFKKLFLKYSNNLILTNYPDYDETKMEEIRYGLEAVYLSITKVVVILFITLLLGIFKEAVLLLLFFNGLRSFAFGIHASKSWMCWVSSSILFIGCPYLCIYSSFPLIIHYIIIGLTLITFIIYAPADTVKRPLIKKNRRIKFKILTIIISIIYIILFFRIDSIVIKNMITCAMLIEAVLIHPLTYKVFRLPYNNYKRYVFSKN